MSTQFYLRGLWEARPETDKELAKRFVRFIDLLSDIDPLLSLWISGARGPKKFETIRDRFEEVVAAEISTDDFGDPDPVDGYWFGAVTRGQPRALTFSVNVHASAYKNETAFQNNVMFHTSYCADAAPAATTYTIFKAALLALVETWEPTFCKALSQSLLDFIGKGRGYFHEAWIVYLAPQLAGLITPPRDVLVEPLPNGGLVMSATTDTFDVENPAHLAAARAIAAAIADLNKLPCADLGPWYKWASDDGTAHGQKRS